jgi:hypothetical protein
MTSPALANLEVCGEASAATTVFELDPLRDARWETLVRKHPRASVFHSTNWLKALHSAYGYEPVVVTTCPPQAVLSNGLVFCRVRSWLTGPRLVSLPFSDHCEALVRNPAEFDSLLLALKQQVDAGRWRYAETRPTDFQPGSLTGLSKNITYRLHRLNLTASTDELFRHFHKSCVQRKIRRAEREQLRYEEGSSEELLNKFYNLLIITRQRLFLPPQPLLWFRELVASFGKDLQIRVVSKDEFPVASILTITHKQIMVYKYGCSDARFNRFGGTALLFWKAIQQAKEGGLVELEMGRSDENNPGLIAFKEHWGAAGTELNYFRYPAVPPKAPMGWQSAALRRIIPATPLYLLRTMGEILYRHIG